MNNKTLDIPNGIIIIIIWMFISCVLNIALSFSIINNYSLNSSLSILIVSNMLLVSINFLIIYGLFCRKIWSWILMFITLFFDIMIAFILCVRFGGIPPLLKILVHMIVILYLLQPNVKEYFGIIGAKKFLLD